MLKVSKQTTKSDGSVWTLEAEGESTKELHAHMAQLEAVFDQTCWIKDDSGKFVSHDVFKCRVRDLGKNVIFRELVCDTNADSRAFKGYTLQLNDDKGTLYPRLKNYETGDAIGTNGWFKFDPNQKKEEE